MTSFTRARDGLPPSVQPARLRVHYCILLYIVTPRVRIRSFFFFPPVDVVFRRTARLKNATLERLRVPTCTYVKYYARVERESHFSDPAASGLIYF